MANIPMKTLRLHGLDDTYTIPTAPEHIGAAPAGYGLGGSSPIITDLNNAINNGWYGVASGTLNIPPVQFTEYSAVFVIRRQSDDITQILFCNALGGRQWIRHLYGQTWSEWVECSPSSFAPAGYGLGANGARLPDYTLLDINSNGFYGIDGSVGEKVPVDENYFWYSNMLKMGAFQLLHGTISNAMVIRNNFTGAEEWVNPPMEVGKEYRTTERYDGKIVYTKLIDFGAMPNTTEKTVGHGIYPFGLPLSVTVVATKDNWSFTLPSDHSIETKVLFNTQGVTIATTLDRSDYNAYATLKYTKD